MLIANDESQGMSQVPSNLTRSAAKLAEVARMLTDVVLELSEAASQLARESDKPKGRSTVAPLEAAEQIGVATATLARWRCEGKGPRYVKSGGRVIYLQEAIDQWLEERQRQHTSE